MSASATLEWTTSAPLVIPPIVSAARMGLVETVVAMIVALQFPPGLLGHCAMPIQLALAVTGIDYMALRSGSGLRAISLQPVRYLALVVLYIFVAHLLVEPESVTAAFIDLAVGGIGLIYVGTLLTTARPRDLLVALVLIHVVLAASDLLLVTARFAGLDQFLHIASFPLKTYTYSVQWYFPFGFVYDQLVPVGNLMLPRAVGIYREPGIYQVFALTACAAAMLLRNLPWRRTIAAIILLGSMSSLSTAWLASFCAMAAMAMVVQINRRSAASLAGLALLLVALAGAILAAALIPGLGFSDKLANESGQDRLRAFASLGPALTSSPWFGLGQSTLQGRDVIESVSGSFVVGVARLGILGTLTFVIAAIATLLARHDRRSIVLLVPLGVTLLTSQPLYYSVVAYFLLAIPCRQALAPVPISYRPPTPAIPLENFTISDLDPEPEPLAILDDVPLVVIDDELDDECEDESIIPLVFTDDELDAVEASR